MTRIQILQSKGYTVRPDTMKRGAVYISRNGVHKWYPNVSAARVAVMGY